MLRPFEGGGRGSKDIHGSPLSLTAGHPSGRAILLIRTGAAQKTKGQSPSMAFALEVPFHNVENHIWPHGLFWREMPGALENPQTTGWEEPSGSPGGRASVQYFLPMSWAWRRGGIHTCPSPGFQTSWVCPSSVYQCTNTTIVPKLYRKTWYLAV